MSEHWVIGNGTAVIEFGMLMESDLKHGKWYRSKEKREGDNPIGSYVMNKKWWLEEEMNMHMMRFQQVTVTVTFSKLLYNCLFQAGLVVNDVSRRDIQGYDPEPLKPLSMEHFLFPLILWLAGLVLSTLTLLAEISTTRCGNNP